MNQTSTKSGLFRKLSIGLGLALAVSTIGVSASSAKSVPHAKKKSIDLVVMLAEKDTGWCTQDSPGGGQIGASTAVLETLTMINDKGVMVPWLAKAFTSTPDFKTWTIELRQGIYYTDGEELTAKNVQTNFAALLGIMPAFYGAGPKGSLPAVAWQGAMKVTTAAEWVTKVKILGTHTISLTLDNPRPMFPYQLWTSGRVRMMSTASLKSATCGTTTAVGTGPFMIKSKGVDPFVTELVRNPNYWRKDKAGVQLPYADTLTFKAILDAGQEVNALAKGQADIGLLGSTAGTQLNRIKEKQKNLIVIEGVRDVNWTFHFNTTAAPFNSQTAREAFSYAFDRVSYAKILCKGNCSAATSVAPKTHPLYFPGMITFDLAKAKEKVAKYKTETGKDLAISLPIADSTESAASGALTCDFMKAAGIACTLMAPVTSTAYILRGFGLQQQLTNFNVLSGPYAEFGLLFLTKTDLELSGFRFTNPALAQCFKDAQMVYTATNKGAYKPCMEELQGKTIWNSSYTEGNFIITGKTVTGLMKTPLPDGGTRSAGGPGGWDWAYTTKA